MEKLKQYYLLGPTFISYNNGLKGCVFLESEKGVVPIELNSEDLDSITKYPNIMERLMNGECLYLKGSKGYIGKKEYIGPYGEEEVFSTEYSSENIGISELIIGLENSIKKRDIKRMQLSKLGIYYNE